MGGPFVTVHRSVEGLRCVTWKGCGVPEPFRTDLFLNLRLEINGEGQDWKSKIERVIDSGGTPVVTWTTLRNGSRR